MVGEDNQAPVKEGQTLDVTIEGVGGKGDGIARVSGFVIFIPNSQKGARVKIKMTKVLAKVGFAEVVGKGEPAKEKQRALYVTAEPNVPEKEYEDPEPSEEDSEEFGEEVEEDEDYMKVE